jgi:hypothetical protein
VKRRLPRSKPQTELIAGLEGAIAHLEWLGPTRRALARSLSERRINVWSGHNFVYDAARLLGLDEEDGVLRIGLAH